MCRMNERHGALAQIERKLAHEEMQMFTDRFLLAFIICDSAVWLIEAVLFYLLLWNANNHCLLLSEIQRMRRSDESPQADRLGNIFPQIKAPAVCTPPLLD